MVDATGQRGCRSTQAEHSAVEEGSEVTLTFAPEGDGTNLTLTHIRFANVAKRDQHIGGWTSS